MQRALHGTWLTLDVSYLLLIVLSSLSLALN